MSCNLNAKSPIAENWTHKNFILYIAFFFVFKVPVYSIKGKHYLNVIVEISIDTSININGEHFQNTLYHTVYPMVPHNVTINEV